MKMSWLLRSEWNKVRRPGVFKKMVKWLKVVCGLEICVCVPLTKGNKFLPHTNGCHLPWENISMIFYPVVDCFGWTAGGTGVQNQNQKQNRWWSTARSARRPQNWWREAGQTILFILKRENEEKKTCQNFRLVYIFSKHIFRLVYRAGNICNHFFTRDFLQVKITQNTKTQNKQVSYERKYLIRER